MSGKKIALMLLIFVLLVASIASGVVWNLTHYVIVGFQFYPKDLQRLDLRDQTVSISQYDRLHRKLPDCEILWDVPFQDTTYPQNTREITVTTLTEKDLQVLPYLPQLERVQAENCTEYALLRRMQQENPRLQVEYSIHFSDGSSCDPNAAEVTFRSVTDDDLALLEHLPNLQKIQAAGGADLEKVAALRSRAQELGLEFSLYMGGKPVSETQKQVTITGVTEQELPLLSLLSGMQTLHLTDPKAPAEQILGLRQQYPNVKITWEVGVGGQTFRDTATEVDLSKAVLTDLKDLEEGVLPYLPDVENVFLGLQDLDNEEIAAFRERSREKFKVVWEVKMGEKATLRTDITYFMPGRDWARGPTFGDDIAYNLRYCEDLICVDVGHLGSVKHVDWLEGLVNLEYLILAHTDIRSLEGIQNCKKLKFLELDWTGIQDLTPLKECTALEDLNIGKAYPDVTPLLEMPWLKNVYMIFGSGHDAYKISQALPDTKVVSSGNATVASGWRNLPNYYAMRDALHAPYMHG